ncbi:hypothetical protein QJS10_CPA07g00562 [Acorus calamus]|uniref:Uncharacterized protein n=1 Tax=Acorus calamus TaxID=4465 RepID=A0AAV9EG43_ACOCL|nr:hypothetical protein QJS10_CPA07g00562 [Acorus calamus]
MKKRVFEVIDVITANVAIIGEHERDKRNQEVQPLKQLMTQYQEQLNTLEEGKLDFSQGLSRVLSKISEVPRKFCKGLVGFTDHWVFMARMDVVLPYPVALVFPRLAMVVDNRDDTIADVSLKKIMGWSNVPKMRPLGGMDEMA